MAANMEAALYADARRLLPSAVPDYKTSLSKATRVFVVCRKHDCPFDPQETPTEDAYVWIKAHLKITFGVLTHAYQQRCELGDQVVTLQLGNGTTPTDDTPISALPTRDQLLVLTAVLPSLLLSTTTSPTSAAMSPTRSQTPRTPLQPVSRQSVVPPAHSQDERSLKMGSQISTQAAAAAAAAAPASPAIRRVAHTPRKRTSIKAESSSKSRAPLSPPVPTLPRSSQARSDAPPALKDEPKEEEPEETHAYHPRDQGDLFVDSQDFDQEESTRGSALQQLTSDESPERLEAGVSAGVRVLSELEAPLRDLGDNEDARNWLRQIEGVRKDANKTRTVVGVVGNTGAGKSSVINAMLDEERLVPTNCMRACTAVVTELSYNESTNPKAKYRAEIEFIQPEEWRKELCILFKELFDDNGDITRDAHNPDSEAGIAYAKIRAVYHKFTRDMLTRTKVEYLMRIKKVQEVLGTSRKINERDPAVFYKRLQQYVDSKEKGTQKLDKNGNKCNTAKRDFEYWPLIKLVRIYIKAEALSTGAIIVDLPGVHDSNAARAAVAEGYMKQCTGLWIVAPINRAVDDKAAKNLLGQSFRRQLKFDGQYSAVTFICSKTDDISRTEASDSLKLGNEMAELEDKMAEILSRRREAKAQLKDAQASKKDHDASIEAIDDDIEVWEDLCSKAEDGKIVYAPSKLKKRKRAAESPLAIKRRRRAVDSDDEDRVPPAEDSLDVPDTSDSGEMSTGPLTEDAINVKLDEMKQMKKDARREKRTLDERIGELEEVLERLEDEEGVIDAKQSALCIAGRNEYSRGAIRQDFSAGIKELDEENAMEEDPDNFDPDQDIRDYDEVANSLPVFCVSSRAYQKLSGRMKKDSAVNGFTDIAETEIPQLQAHCRKLTEKGRQAGCRRFLNSMKQLLTSLSLWASDDGTGAKLTTKQRDVEKSFLTRKLKELEKALEKVVSDTLEDVGGTLNEQLFEKFPSAIRAASDEAVPIGSKWGLPKPAGGLHFMTYRATVRRSGVFAGSSGQRDFNGELVEPIYKHLASAWEKTFQRRLPHILQSFTRSASDVLKKFHAAVEQRTREKGHGVSHIGMLGNQLTGYSAIFGDLVTAAVASLNEGQREVNREFAPVIAEIMEPAYSICGDEAGKGCYARMKGHMADHITQQKSSMFQDASDQVRSSLTKLCETIRKTMLDKADNVFVSMKRDYILIISGVNVGEVRLSRGERAARRVVDEAISGAEGYFQDLLQVDLAELKAQVAQQDIKTEALESNDAVDADDIAFDDPSSADEDESDVDAAMSSDEAGETSKEDDDVDGQDAGASFKEDGEL